MWFFIYVASRAPLAERSAVNRQVLGSIPSGGVFLFAMIRVDFPHIYTRSGIHN